MRRLLFAVSMLAMSTTAAHAAMVQLAYGPRLVEETPAQVRAESNQTDPCARAVQIEQHDKWLSVKRGIAADLREGSKAQLTFAGAAASHGKEARCWYRLGLAQDLNAP